MNKTLAVRFTVGLAIAFVVILGLLHILEPEFNFDGHLISEYELGNVGWLMALAFWSLAGASLSLWVVLKDDLKTLGGRIGKWWLLLVAVAYIGAGLFYPDTGGVGLPADPAVYSRSEIAPTLNATLHGISGMIIIGSSPIVFTLLARSLAKNPKWIDRAKGLRLPTWLAWTGLLLFPISLTLYSTLQQPDGFDYRDLASLVNRLMILAYAAWLAICAQLSLKAKR